MTREQIKQGEAVVSAMDQIRNVQDILKQNIRLLRIGNGDDEDTEMLDFANPHIRPLLDTLRKALQDHHLTLENYFKAL
jgi:hypothetical protein